eukprot:12720898-Ditylum_brightwellii.AAC.1
MGFSCSSAAMLLLWGGECGSGGVNELDIVVVLVSEKKKEEDTKRVHSWVRKLFLKGFVWEEKMLSSGKESTLITIAVFLQEDKEQERQKKGDECGSRLWPCPVVDKVERIGMTFITDFWHATYLSAEMDSNITSRLPAEEQ